MGKDLEKEMKKVSKKLLGSTKHKKDEYLYALKNKTKLKGKLA